MFQVGGGGLVLQAAVLSATIGFDGVFGAGHRLVVAPSLVDARLLALGVALESHSEPQSRQGLPRRENKKRRHAPC